MNTLDLLGSRPFHFCAEHVGTGGFYNSEQVCETYISLVVNGGAYLDNGNGHEAAYEGKLPMMSQSVVL